MGCADRNTRFEPEAREIGRQILVLGVVYFINDKDDWFARFAQHTCEFVIDRRQTLLGINEQKQKLTFVDRFFRGMPYLGEQF